MSDSAWLQLQPEGSQQVLYLVGVWRLMNLRGIARDLPRPDLGPTPGLVLDGSRLQELDTAACFTLFRHLSSLGLTAATVQVRGFAPRHRQLIALVHERMNVPPCAPASRPPGLVQRVGATVWRAAGLFKGHVAFLGEVALELARLPLRPRLFRFREALAQMEAVGVDAIPIVVMLTFLIGVVFAYLLGVQAQRYGATIFVVDGIGLAVCRELSPLLAAVLVAGRSGAAFTAEIGSMKVQEEVDAIRTLGLSPVQVLVVPRLVAIIVTLPLLVFVGDLAGVLGGQLIAATQLDISTQAFMNRLHATLTTKAVVVGLVKAPVFAACIAMIACRMGLMVSRDARSVGQNTTSTVVQSICWVIVIDAVFAVVLQRLGI
jgi:phospholipid/cholesterol/gamma-HCH transport system permease protein